MGETKTNTFWRSIISARYSRLVGFVAAMCLFVIFGFALVPVCDKPEDTFAAPTPSTTTLAMTTPSVSLSLALSDVAGTFAVSNPASFSVTTNNYTGYALSIRAKEDNANNSKLINGSHVLNSISAATADGTGFNVGDWGYKPSKLNSSDNTDFLPAPTYAGSVLNATTTANSTADNYFLAIAAKANVNTVSGTYSNTFVLAAVPNAVNYTITYNKNTTDTVSNMPTTQSGELSTNDVILSANTPSRTGAIFLGWCNGTTTQVVNITTDDSCNGTTYAAGATYPTSMQTANTAELKAMWRVLPPAGTFNRAYYDAGKTTVTVSGTKYYQMQEMTTDICTAVTTGNTGQLVDNRDNTVYNIGKMQDGFCWMLDNLALDVVANKNKLSSSNTASSDTALGYLKNGGGTTSDFYSVSSAAYWNGSNDDGHSALVYTNLKNTTNTTDSLVEARTWKYGVLYNLCAASGGASCRNGNRYNAYLLGSICPVDWHIPSAGPIAAIGPYSKTDEWQNLKRKGNIRTALHLPFSGGIYNNTLSGQGTEGYFWASTGANSSTRSGFYTSAESTTNKTIQPAGQFRMAAVRCIANYQ